MSLRVAVIGAGMAGLTALRQLTRHPAIRSVVAFEQTNKLGGLWNYEEKKGYNENGYPTSGVFQGMMTNTPTEITRFSDMPFHKTSRSFVGHMDVLKYLEDYADCFHLKPFIQFGTSVLNVQPCSKAPGTKWNISISKTNRPSEKEHHEFDAVFVCTGQFRWPYIPNMPGKEDFKGKITHSKDYRFAQEFTGRRVACVGGNFSGVDIALTLLPPFAKQVYLCRMYNEQIGEDERPKNLSLKPSAIAFTPEGLVLSQGDHIAVDDVIFCTGFIPHLPFLSDDCGLTTHEGTVNPLWKHCLNAEFPTMAVIGMCRESSAFHTAEWQSKFAIKAFTGEMRLPSRELMLVDVEAHKAGTISRGHPLRRAHSLNFEINEYLLELSCVGGIERCDPNVGFLLKDAMRRLAEHPATFRDINYTVHGPGRFEAFFHAESSKEKLGHSRAE